MTMAGEKSENDARHLRADPAFARSAAQRDRTAAEKAGLARKRPAHV